MGVVPQIEMWGGHPVIGTVEKVHCVSNRRFGAKKRPAAKAAPQGLDWQSWIGPAPFREFHDGLHPFSWRGCRSG